ncbi:MAG: hypothetical protein ACRCUJ_02365, partial [Phocaeicola sp.]
MAGNAPFFGPIGWKYSVLCECLQTYFLQKELKVAGDTPILDHQLANLRTLRLSRNGWGCSVLC